MTLSQLVLAAGALAFAIFGVWLLAVPGALKAVGITPASPEARTELRAMYGGLELGIAAFLLLCITRTEWHGPGLLLQALAIGGLAAARLIAIAIERGRVRGLLWFFASLELIGAAITWLVFAQSH